MRKTEELDVGNVGYVIANIKSLGDMDVGDTITNRRQPRADGAARLQADRADGVLRPVSQRRRRGSTICATRWRSSSSTIRRCIFEPESSIALGFGFRCGFLGLLAHGDRPGAARAQLQPRPDRDVAVGRVPRDVKNDGAVEMIDNPAKLPARDKIAIDRRAVRQGDDHHAARLRRGRSWSSRRTGAERSPTWNTCTTAASS